MKAETSPKTDYIHEAISEAFYTSGLPDVFDLLPKEKQIEIAKSLQVSIECMSMNFYQPSTSDYISELNQKHAREIAIAANRMKELSLCCDAVIISSYQGLGDYRNTCSKCDRFCKTYIKRN